MYSDQQILSGILKHSLNFLCQTRSADITKSKGRIFGPLGQYARLYIRFLMTIYLNNWIFPFKINKDFKQNKMTENNTIIKVEKSSPNATF